MMVLVFALAAGLVTGCGAPATPTPAPSPKPEPEAPKEVTLTIGTPYSIETFDPTKYSSDGDYYVLSQIMEPLVNVDGTNIVPRLAESWENPDDLTWVFHLRKGMTWHDGNAVYPAGSKVEVTAQDVKKTFDFILDPANQARLQATLDAVIEKVEVVDSHTVKFVTREPYAFFLNDLNRVPIFSMEALEKLGRDEFAKYPIGCGPFRFVEFRVDDRVILEANPDFFIKPRVDRVVFRIIPDKSVSLMALETGEVDISLQLPTADVPRLLQDESITVIRNTFGWYRYAAFNFNVPLFQDAKVREAIAAALDMEEITRMIFPEEQLAETAYGPVPRGIPGFSDNWKQMWSHDVEKAKQLLAEAGWTPGRDGVLEKDGQKMSFSLKVHNDPNRQKMATLIATQLKAVGIDAQVQVRDWATHLDEIRKGNTEMFIMGGGSTPDGLLYMFHSVNAAGQAHNTFYKNAELDALLDESKRTVNLEERVKLWTRAAEITIKDRVHLGGYLEYIQIGTKSSVEGFLPPTPWVSLTNTTRNVGFKK